jgi:perosamine synthetase
MIGLVPRDHWEHNLGDLLRGLTAALSLREQSKTLKIAKLGPCIPTRSGRSALVAALKALNLPRGAQIGVPLYCCSVVFKAIKVAGCKACFVDIEPDTFCMSAGDLFSKRNQIDAIIAVHMFGNLCDIEALKAAANGKPIIEHCAQSLGSKIRGRMAGSFGTIAFFSFRSGKYLSVGEGGALFSSDLDIRFRLTQIITAMPDIGRIEEFIHVLKTYIRSMLRRKPLYGLVGYPLWAIYNKKVDYTVKASFDLSQIFRADLTITKSRLPLIDSLIERQRANADFYTHSLELNPGMLCWEKPGTFLTAIITQLHLLRLNTVTLLLPICSDGRSIP